MQLKSIWTVVHLILKWRTFHMIFVNETCVTTPLSYNFHLEQLS